MFVNKAATSLILPNMVMSQYSYRCQRPYALQMLNTQAATAILQTICDHDATIPDFISFILHHAPLQDHPITQNVFDHPTEVITVLVDCPALHECIVEWALRLADRCHSKSVQRLSRIQNGWHFSALHTSVEQIQEF